MQRPWAPGAEWQCPGTVLSISAPSCRGSEAHLRCILAYCVHPELPHGSVAKNAPATQETWVQSLGGGRYPGEGNGQRNWMATVHGVAKSQTQLSMHTHVHTCVNAPRTDSNTTSSSTPCHLPQGKQSPSCSRASLHQPSFTFESIIPTCGMKGGVSQVK